MSMSSEPPERLAEILLEILALSDSTRTSQSESVSGSDQLNYSTRTALKSSRNGEMRKTTTGKDRSAGPRARVRA